MNRQWMYSKQRTSTEYTTNVENFLEFAYQRKNVDDKIYCPCAKCDNRYFMDKNTVRGHLIKFGFTDKYWVWTSHGESYAQPHTSQINKDGCISEMGDDMVGLVHDAFGIPNVNFNFGNQQPSDYGHPSGPAHRIGRTPFSILREEMKKQGLKTDEQSVYIKTRTDKSGATKDDEASRIIASMEEKLSCIPESERTEEVRQCIFKEAMGEECHGYSRTMGLGLTPSQLVAKSCMSYQPSNELMAKIWSQVEDFYVQKFSGIIEGMQTQINNLNTQLEIMRSVKDGSPAIACTKCVHKVPDASNAPQLDTNLQKNSVSHELHETPMDEGI